MRFNDLKKKSLGDLQKELDAKILELLRYNAKVATGGAGKEAGNIKELRKTIARIKTLQAINNKKK